jgi:hypothetical protein
MAIPGFQTWLWAGVVLNVARLSWTRELDRKRECIWYVHKAKSTVAERQCR